MCDAQGGDARGPWGREKAGGGVMQRRARRTLRHPPRVRSRLPVRVGASSAALIITRKACDGRTSRFVKLLLIDVADHPSRSMMEGRPCLRWSFLECALAVGAQDRDDDEPEGRHFVRHLPEPAREDGVLGDLRIVDARAARQADRVGHRRELNQRSSKLCLRASAQASILLRARRGRAQHVLLSSCTAREVRVPRQRRQVKWTGR